MILVPVILCGGSGTRLWPLSRSQYPKQFMDLGESSLFADTVRRALSLSDTEIQAGSSASGAEADDHNELIPCAAPCVVCNESQRFLAASALQALHVNATILLEHQGRNTAPAIALAALSALEQHADPVLLVLPSDHVMEPLESFAAAVRNGLVHAKAGRLVTFGIRPGGPETGYGYIRHGAALGAKETGGYEAAGKANVRGEASERLSEDAVAFAVDAFEEKPPRERAEQLLAGGQCSWNSGIFLFKASVFLDELKQHAPAMYQAIEDLWNSRSADMDFVRFDPALCEACPANSIDYAVMEHTEKAVVVPLAVRWSDLGSWDAFYQIADKDAQQNACVGDVLLEDTRGSYIHASGRLVATLGMRDTVVVETPDAVLVADRRRTQDVRRVLDRLKKAGRSETENHVKVFRPWGAYQSLVLGERFQVKRIEVKPGASLSLQLHHHRAEHWVVVSGTARIVRGDKTLLLGEDQSTYIPLGCEHRLENPGCIPLVIIEIQTGSYLGEDDIVRLEDRYGRMDEKN